MKRHFKNNPSPDFFDSFINGISNMSVLSAIGVFGTVIAVSLAVYITVISPVVIFPSFFRADPTGLIRGNPLDVVLGDNLLSIDSTGLTVTCPSGDTNLCTEITSINDQIIVINARLNITNGTSISAASIEYNGYQPYYTTNVTTIEEAADDTSVRLYDNVISISLTPSRFPALSFPTDQITVDEDVGRRLRLLETATPTNSTATTSLPAANITFTPTNSSNWNPAPTELQTSTDQLAARVTTLEHATAANVTLSSLAYTNGAFFMTNVSNGNAALNNIVGEMLVHDAQITTLQSQMTTVQGQTSQLLTRKNRDWFVSATYGNDATCDGSASLPCATASRTMLFFSNSSSPFAQNSILFDNGFYSEPAYVSIPPNTLFIGNEIGTLLIFGAGAGLHPTAWSTTGTGYVTFLRFGLIRCTGAPCAFDTSTVLPLVPVFASFRFYNSTLETVTPFSFTRAAGTSSYFELRMESTVISGGTLTLQDLTSITWDLSGDIYTILNINYNYTSTYGSGTPTINMNGIVAHSNIVVNNFAPTLLVDWSLLDVVLRDAATLTRNYVSGANVNIHGDILSLGSINGGLLTTGAGSGTKEYLTKDYGMGTAQDTPSDWDTPYPENQHETNTQLAKRTRVLENTPQRRYYISFAANTTTSVSIPSNVTVVYFTACGGGSSGVGAFPGSGDGGNAGAGILDLPIINRGVSFVVTVGLGGASGATSNSGTDTTITNSLETITLEAGQSVGGLNRGGNVIITNSPLNDSPTTDIIVTGTAGSGTPGGASVFSGYMYGGAGGGSSRPNAFPGYSGGYTAMLSERSSGSAGGSGGNTNGGGGGSSILGIGGTGGSGSGDNNGSPGGRCAGGGGAGNTNTLSPTNGGAGGDGDAWLYYYIV